MKSLTDKQQLLLDTLRKNYPLAFPDTPVPLKSGILADMKAEIDDFGGNCIKKLIIYYCRQEEYLQVIANAKPGSARVALDGSPDTTVTEEHIVYSRKKLVRIRRRKLKRSTLRQNSIQHRRVKDRKILSLKKTTYAPQASPAPKLNFSDLQKNQLAVGDTKGH